MILSGPRGGAPTTSTIPVTVNQTRAAFWAKLRPPATIAGDVDRTAVGDLVSASPARRVILFRAPAGFGKTTAMAQCRRRLAESGAATAWLTLDSSDNDVARFLDGLGRAVAALTDQDTPNAAADASAGTRWVGDLALDIVNRLAGHPSAFGLFLDDFEAIHEPGALGIVREIIGNLPRGGQLIIGSRSLPDLGLGRLRAREQLLEIEARELRFSVEEAAAFLNRRRASRLTADDVLHLHRKTEGWAAGLSLASLALSRHDEPGALISGFSGSSQALVEYLAEDVLAGQPVHVRDFLLRTSILRELNPSLCQALVPGMDADAVLTELERANLFLTPIEGTERRYRYHSLFAAFLRGQATRDLPAELPHLHQAAGVWYESQGRPIPAVDHALEAGDFDHALELIGTHAESLLAQGRLRLLSRWFALVPSDVLRRSPLLEIIEVWAAALTRGPSVGLALLHQSGCERSADPAVAAYVLALRPMLLAMLDRYEEAQAAARESLVRMAPGHRFAAMALANAKAEILSVMGRRDDARRYLDDARRRQGDGESTFNVMYSESVEGAIDLLEGRLRQATARFRMAVGATPSASLGQTSGNAWAGVFYALSVYEANDLDQAARLLSVYLPLVKNVSLPDHMILGYRMLSRIAFCRGEVDQAFELLTELEYLGQQRQLPRVVATAKLDRARILLHQGHARAAGLELDRADDRPLWERVERLRHPANDLEYMELARLRWEVLSGRAGPALPRLDREIAAAEAASRVRRGLKLRLLRAMALGRSGNDREALTAAGSVLRATWAEGFVRLVLDEGEVAAALVRKVDERLREDASGQRDPTYRDYVQRLCRAFGPGVGEDEAQVGDGHASLQEPLTPKEITVLQLLAEGYSNSALAEKLFVADTTVRTHLRNINGKLGARSRTHAVAVARRMGLIA
jgi:LuxR family maltose regulon positive regulatory protein